MQKPQNNKGTKITFCSKVLPYLFIANFQKDQLSQINTIYNL